VERHKEWWDNLLTPWQFPTLRPGVTGRVDYTRAMNPGNMALIDGVVMGSLSVTRLLEICGQVHQQHPNATIEPMNMISSTISRRYLLFKADSQTICQFSLDTGELTTPNYKTLADLINTTR
jgi:hypothetical protein